MRKFSNYRLSIKRHIFENSFVRKILQGYIRKKFKEPISENVRPIFIVGCGHSGTSLLCAVLDSHSKLSAISGENYAFWLWNKKNLVVEKFGKKFEEITEAGFRPLEKTPRHIYVIPNILALYPNCQIIYIVRDPRGVISSLRMRTGKFYAGIRRWIADNQAGSLYLSDPRLTVLRFEDMLLATNKTFESLCNFLGIDLEQGLFQHNNQHRDWYGSQKNADEHAKRRFNQINSPIDKSYADKWKNELTDHERRLIEKSCCALMKEFGYSCN